MLKRSIWGAGIAAIALAVILVIWNPLASTTAALTPEAAMETVLGQYPGEIVEAKLVDDQYLIKLKLVTGLYDVRLSADHGEIESINQLEAFDKGGTQIPEPSVTPQASEKPAPTPKPTDEPTKPTDVSNTPSEPATSKPSATPAPSKPTAAILTEKAAADIAVEELGGYVDDVDLEQSGQQRYYLVELEFDDGRDAVVQVHAISGAIMSITWDDDDDDV